MDIDYERTAIGCIKNALEDTKKILIIISTPQPDLSSQWKTDIDKLDIGLKNSMEINGNVLNWDIALSKEIRKLSTGLSKYELGQSEPDIQMITKLASYFQVSTDYLLGLSDSKICVTVINLSDDEKNVLYDYKRMDKIQKIKVAAYMKGLLQE